MKSISLDALINKLIEFGTSFGLKLIGALVVFIIGRKLIKWLKKWITTSKKLDKFDTGVRTFLSSFTTVALYAILFITVAMILGIPTTSFITALASCGVAIGLALQGSLSNLAGGLMILLFKPFKVGDYIETPDAAGTVSDITVMYTFLTTPDNKVITIPNGTLTNSVVQNFSAVENRRVDLTFTTDYNCSIDEVKAILMDVVNAHSLVLQDPEPFARLSAHGDSALEFTVRVWCKSDDYWDVRFDLLESVKKAFDENNIGIPYPQLDVHLDK